MKVPRAIGIDLGTTNSLAAWVSETGPRLVTYDGGRRAIVPSVVAFDDAGRATVGLAALRDAPRNPRRTLFSIKRFMGRALADVKEKAALLPFPLEEAAGGKAIGLRVNDRLYTPQEVSALVLREIVSHVAAFFGEPVKRAVITVPAWFDDAQRQATRDAGEMAGLEVLRIINEPTAAAVAYGLDLRRDARVAVYDLGGGTFDVSVLELSGGVFRVLASRGDTWLGGDDFDQALMRRALDDIRATQGKDLASDPAAVQTLRAACEETKIRLSTREGAALGFDWPPAGVRYERAVTRAEFEALIEPLLARTMACVSETLRDAGLTPKEVDEVVCVGGCTRIPRVRRLLRDHFGREPHTALNPDEVVALGAGVQADLLTGGKREILLLDVIPLSLGIETMGGAMTKIIMRNSTIPATASETFSTWADNQTGIDIHVLQGERELVRDCRSLGRFRLSGLPPMAAGVPKLVVTFQVDQNGILSVRAREERSGRELAAAVEPTYGLTRDEVRRMVRDSIANMEGDFAARRLLETKNKVSQILLHTRAQLPEARAFYDPARIAEIEAALTAAAPLLEGDDFEALERAAARLGELTVPLADALVNHELSRLEGRHADGALGLGG